MYDQSAPKQKRERNNHVKNTNVMLQKDLCSVGMESVDCNVMFSLFIFFWRFVLGNSAQ